MMKNLHSIAHVTVELRITTVVGTIHQNTVPQKNSVIAKSSMCKLNLSLNALSD